MFPIHAAGYHSSSGKNVLDRVISCYTPTIKGLQYARQRHAQLRKRKHPRKVALIAIPETPGGQQSLPFTNSELEKICNFLSAPVVISILRFPIKRQVLDALNQHDIAHFVCHGSADPLDPSKSLLKVADWESDPLSVADIVSLRLQNAAFAYLSACHGANIQVTKLLNEGLHIAGAFQLAGYPQVVGALWHILDEHAVNVSESIYKVLVSGGLQDLRVAEALHHAIGKLREATRWEEDSTEEYPDQPITWAPYIYMGA
jgi:CHAT domain-containing protein